jgi:hypothetical protein
MFARPCSLDLLLRFDECVGHFFFASRFLLSVYFGFADLLFILSYGMEPMGYGLKMRKKARKEKQ